MLSIMAIVVLIGVPLIIAAGLHMMLKVANQNCRSCSGYSDNVVPLRQFPTAVDSFEEQQTGIVRVANT